MKKKYIIEIDDDRNIIRNCGKTMLAVSIAIGKIAGSINTGIELTPYTEPDLEQIRKAAYEKGYKKCMSENDFDSPCVSCDKYQQGLADAWEAARKIIFNPDDGGMSAVDVHEVFGESSWTVMKDFSVSEVIAKIKAWEEKKQEQEIKVGDVVRLKDNPELKIWVTSIPDENGMLFGLELKEVGANKRKFERTGEHHEVGTILEKLECENK